jgi:hypothetical protein
MNTRIIHDHEELRAWEQECQAWDRDFETGIHPCNLPMLFVWQHTEVNDFPDITYETFSIEELERFLVDMKEFKHAGDNI